MKMKWIQKLRQIDIGISVIASPADCSDFCRGYFPVRLFKAFFMAGRSAAGADHMGYFFRGKICI